MYRVINLGIVLIVVASMLFAIFYLEGVLSLDPCPLCMVDRAILIIIAIISLVALLHNSSGKFRLLYTTLTALFCGLGIAVSARHIWLQGLPADQVPECGPDLNYMLEVFPFAEVIKRIFTGSGECAQVSWTFIGMTIPQQTLILFVVLLLMTLVAHFQRP